MEQRNVSSDLWDSSWRTLSLLANAANQKCEPNTSPTPSETFSDLLVGPLRPLRPHLLIHTMVKAHATSKVKTYQAEPPWTNKQKVLVVIITTSKRASSYKVSL